MGGGGSSSSGESWSATTPGFTEELGSVLQANLAGTTGFGKQDAIADVHGVMRQQATNALQESMPAIARQQIGAGAYDSTTKGLLQNDLQARIVGQLAATQSQAIKDYAAIDADRIRAFSAATQAGTSSAMEHWESAKSRKEGGLLSNLAQGAIGGALGLLFGDDDGIGSSSGSSSSLGNTTGTIRANPKDSVIHGFQNGGRVQPKPRLREDEKLNTMEQVLLKSFEDAINTLSLPDSGIIKKPPKNTDYKAIEYDLEKPKKKPKVVTSKDKDDDASEIFSRIGLV